MVQYILLIIHSSQLFSWPIYSQSTDLFQRLKQIVDVCLETQQFYSQISKKNLASRKIKKLYFYSFNFELFLSEIRLKITVKYLHSNLTLKSDIFV